MCKDGQWSQVAIEPIFIATLVVFIYGRVCSELKGWFLHVIGNNFGARRSQFKVWRECTNVSHDVRGHTTKVCKFFYHNLLGSFNAKKFKGRMRMDVSTWVFMLLTRNLHAKARYEYALCSSGLT